MSKGKPLAVRPIDNVTPARLLLNVMSTPPNTPRLKLNPKDHPTAT
jgi:hypothetical protein